MSAALGLRTEASTRHEKSLAPALTDIGAARAAQLLRDLGATAYRPHEFGTPLQSPAPIPLYVDDVERLLGLTLPANRIAAHLAALGCGVSGGDGATLSVVPPPWRRDLTLATDLIEEVARVEGYERIAAVVPSVPAHEISSAKFALENRIAHALAALGYREVITHSLRAHSGDAAVEVRNPLSEEQRFLRTSLVPGLLEYLAGVAIPAYVFELGQIFAREDGKIVEQTTVAFGFSAKRTGEPSWRDSSFLQLKGDCEALLREVTGRMAEVARGARSDFHPGKSAIVSIDGVSVGVLGCLDPRLSRAHELDGNGYLCVIAVDALPPYAIPRYRPPSRFPSTYRDLALVLDVATAAGEVENAVTSALGSLCTGARVFDEYRGAQVGEGRKSLALRVTLQRFDATITDEEADAAIARVLQTLRERFGATLRT
jgi:phenylalanyl-tRNA synthetase beta chain